MVSSSQSHKKNLDFRGQDDEPDYAERGKRMRQKRSCDAQGDVLCPEGE